MVQAMLECRKRKQTTLKSLLCVLVYMSVSYDSCKIEYGDGDVQGNKDTTVRMCYAFTVNDSPHPQASVTLGFLNSNFELGLCRQTESGSPSYYKHVP